ncbi:MAG TPA: CmpA/NrtA family ABC transporter substrate-binding protein [Stenotrophomonas sp.]|nr:CmpA/NrtA family ABC transporter substrate-binding protein [Stenotrophomonas sp.]
MNEREAVPLAVAYMPLIDCAPLVAASRLGLDRTHGLQLQLRRQASWATVRDRLLSGEVQAAHLPASMVLGIDLGIAGPAAPMAWLLTLNQNGQAITLARALADALLAGQSLPQVFAGLARRPVLAQTFPTGTHALWLYHWLAASGVDPMRAIDALSIPPPQMPAALAAGEIDGYCSGEPWATVAEAQGSGRRVVRSGALWPGHPEKVLACRRDLAALQPELAEALIACVLAACRWLDESPDHRRQCARWLAEPELIGASEAQLAQCLAEDPRDPQALAFHRDGAVNLPWLSDGEWLFRQFVRWGWCGNAAMDAMRLQDIHRLHSYRRAAAAIGVTVPRSDRREGAPDF